MDIVRKTLQKKKEKKKSIVLNDKKKEAIYCEYSNKTNHIPALIMINASADFTIPQKTTSV